MNLKCEQSKTKKDGNVEKRKKKKYRLTMAYIQLDSDHVENIF